MNCLQYPCTIARCGCCPKQSRIPTRPVCPTDSLSTPHTCMTHSWVPLPPRLACLEIINNLTPLSVFLSFSLLTTRNGWFISLIYIIDWNHDLEKIKIRKLIVFRRCLCVYVWEKFERSKKDTMIMRRYYHRIKENLKSIEMNLIHLFKQYCSPKKNQKSLKSIIINFLKNRISVNLRCWDLHFVSERQFVYQLCYLRFL